MTDETFFVIVFSYIYCTAGKSKVIVVSVKPAPPTKINEHKLQSS